MWNTIKRPTKRQERWWTEKTHRTSHSKMRTKQSGAYAHGQIRHNPTNTPEHIRKLTNLKAGIKKELKHTIKVTTTKGVFGKLL